MKVLYLSTVAAVAIGLGIVIQAAQVARPRRRADVVRVGDAVAAPRERRSHCRRNAQPREWRADWWFDPPRQT